MLKKSWKINNYIGEKCPNPVELLGKKINLQEEQATIICFFVLSDSGSRPLAFSFVSISKLATRLIHSKLSHWWHNVD